MQPFEDVKIEGKHLKLFIPDRTCVYWAKDGPDSEPTTNAWIDSFESDDTFVDIGANIGLYSLLAAASRVSKVYAFEPNPFTFSVLTRNIFSNGFNSIIFPFCLPLNEASALVTFKLEGLHAGSVRNGIVRNGQDLEDKTITTASFSVDEFFKLQDISNVNHLKIDVDGLELKILRGATDLLSNRALKSILVEIDSEENELISLLEKYGFHQTDVWGQDNTINKIFTRN
jgi:FkbM family methyltransferase